MYDDPSSYYTGSSNRYCRCFFAYSYNWCLSSLYLAVFVFVGDYVLNCDGEWWEHFEFYNDYPFKRAIEEVDKGLLTEILLSRWPCDILLAEMSKYFLFEFMDGLLFLEFLNRDLSADLCTLLIFIIWLFSMNWGKF